MTCHRPQKCLPLYHIKSTGGPASQSDRTEGMFYTATFLKDTITDVRRNRNDIMACVGKEVLNPLLKGSIYKRWVLFDIMTDPDNPPKVRKGAEGEKVRLTEALSSLFDTYQTALAKQGVNDFHQFILS